MCQSNKCAFEDCAGSCAEEYYYNKFIPRYNITICMLGYYLAGNEKHLMSDQERFIKQNQEFMEDVEKDFNERKKNNDWKEAKPFNFKNFHPIKLI